MLQVLDLFLMFKPHLDAFLSDGYLSMEFAYIRHHCHLDFPLYIEPLWHPNSSVFCRSTLLLRLVTLLAVSRPR